MHMSPVSVANTAPNPRLASLGWGRGHPLVTVDRILRWPHLDRLAIVLVLLLAVLLRAWRIDGMSIWQDEGLSLYRATRDWAGILGGQIPLDDLMTQDVHPPFYFLLLGAWFRLVGVTTWSARWLSLLVSLPGVALVWALGRRVTGRPGAQLAALLTALLAALSPLLLWYAREIRSYALLVTLGAATVYALTRALDGRAPARSRLVWSLGTAAAGALAMWTHYLGFLVGAFAVGAVAVAAVARLVRRHAGARIRTSGPLVVLLVGVVLTVIPLLPFALHRLTSGAERDQHFVPLPVILLDVVRGFAFGRTLYADPLSETGRFLVAGLYLVAAAVAIAGLLALWRRRPARATFVAGYLLVPAVGLYALTLVKPVYLGVYHLIAAAPAFYLLLGAGLAALAQRHRWLAVLAAAVLFGGMGWADRNLYADPRVGKDDLRALAAYVDARAVPGDVLAVSDPVLVRSFEFLVRRIPVIAVPRMLYTSDLDDRPPAEQLAPLLAEYDRLWFMTPKEEHQAWLDQHAVAVDHATFPGTSIPVWLRAYQRRETAGVQVDTAGQGLDASPAGDGSPGGDATTDRDVSGGEGAATGGGAAAGPPSTADDRLGDRQLARWRFRLVADGRLGDLRLVAWRFRPEPMQVGRAARVDLWWRIEATAAPPDYKVALRLLDATGRDWAAGDHAPFHDLWPTSRWPRGGGAGDVLEPHDLLVSPGATPGTYRLAVTVYDPATGQRFPDGDHLVLGEVRVDQADTPIDPHAVAVAHRLSARVGGWRIFGHDPVAGSRQPGERLTVGVWLEATATSPRPLGLGLDVVDSSGRTIRAGALAAVDSSLPGELRLAHLAVDLPVHGGVYGLRLRAVDEDGARRWLWRGPLPARALWLGTVAVVEPERSDALPGSARPMAAAVGDRINLVGFEGPTGTVAAGGRLAGTLFWRAEAQVPTGYHVTVQLVPVAAPGAEVPVGGPVAQHDGVPGNGTRPTTGWAPGEIVADRHALRLAPDIAPGAYLLIAALYDPDAPGMPRLLVSQDGQTRDFALLEPVLIPSAREAGATP